AWRAPRDNWTGWGGAWLHFWGAVHIGLYILGAVFTCLAFVAGLMYLAQAHRLKQKRPPRFGITLPSPEQSGRLDPAAITLAFPLLTFAIGIGLALILTTQRAGERVLGWTDPKVLSAGAMWLAFAALLHARYRPAMRGRRVMILTMEAFAFLVFSL